MTSSWNDYRFSIRGGWIGILSSSGLGMTALSSALDTNSPRKHVREVPLEYRLQTGQPRRDNDHPSQTRLNRFQRRECESLHLWPSYELYIRHPSVPNFFLLPTFFEEQSRSHCHSWEAPYHFVEYRVYPSPPFYSTQHPHTPTHYNSRAQAQEMTPKTRRSSSRKSKRKYEELFNEDQFLMNDRDLSVFLDFDNE
jgi:hypothetical protein